MVEYAWIPGVVSAAVAFWSLVRVEQVRKSASGDELRQKQGEDVALLQKKIDLEGSILREKHEILHMKLSIMEARLKPLFDTFDKRLSEMFHQPHPSAWRLDALVEEYRRDAERMSDQRLQEIINEIWVIRQQASKQGSEPDPFVFFLSNLQLGFMDGRRDARQLQRVYATRLRQLEANQVTLEAERQRLIETPPPAPRQETPHRWTQRWTQWWTHFSTWLAGFR